MNAGTGKSLRGSLKGLLGALLLCLVGSGVMAACALAGDLEARYIQLKREFQASAAIPEKEKRQESLQRCLVKLEQMVGEDKEGKVSDKCLYLIGQGHHHLYEINRNREDLRIAIEHYRLVVQKYPSSPIADDAQYLVAMLHIQDNPAQAYIEFAKVGLFFPKGDKRHKAAEMAAKLEKQLGCGPKKRKGAGSAFPNEFAASVSSVPSAESAGGSSTPSSSLLHAQGKASGASESSILSEAAAACPIVKQLVKINHVTGEEYTRVILYTDEPVHFERQITPADPKSKQHAKISVVLKDCVLNPKLEIESFEKDPFLKGVHATQDDGSQSRVTLDVQSIDAYRVFSLSDPFRLIVDVRGKRPEQSASVSKQGRQGPEASATGGPKEEAGEPGASPPSQKKSSAIPSLARQLALDVKRIVLDPGHGGKDKGAISPNNVYEKDVVLSIAKRLKQTLEERTGCEVILTRTRDRFLTLEERTAIANAKKADLFISIHTNAHEDRSLHGVETYFLNLTKDKEAARVAALENAMSTKKISDLEAILHDLMLNTKINESKQLATEVHRNVVRNLRANYENVKDLGTKQAPFYVLLGAEMPSVLIESAFISNGIEESRLRDKNYQENLASAITAGIESYIQHMKTFAKAGEHQ